MESEESGVSQKTIIIADDHPVVRKSLRIEIEKDQNFKVIAEASNGEEVIELVREFVPNAVIMDIGMPVINGIEATRRIKELYPDIIVMVLTVHDDIRYVTGILESGADGYLTKNSPLEDVVQALRSILSGRTVLSSEIYKKIIQYAMRKNIKLGRIEGKKNLSNRELEVLNKLAKGMGNKQIADELNINIRTVKTHIVDIFGKLGVFTRTEAVTTALRAGLIKLDNLDE